MEERFQDHLARVDRLLALVRRRAIAPLAGVLTYHDLLVVTCQAMWSLRDIVLRDRALMPRDPEELLSDIHEEWCFLSCADVARGVSTLTPVRPATARSAASWYRAERIASSAADAPQYYVHATDPEDAYHGAEVEALLLDCRDAWARILEKHWLEGMRF